MLLFDNQLWSRLVFKKPVELLCMCKHELNSDGDATSSELVLCEFEPISRPIVQ